MGLLLLLFIAVPLIDVWLLFRIADLVGGLNTIWIVILTGILGASLSKFEGARVLEQWKASLAEGRTPEQGVLGGVLWLAGSLLLITPGVITDVVGLLLLLPPTRSLAIRMIRPWLEAKVRSGVVEVVEQPTIRVVHFGSGVVGPGFPENFVPFHPEDLHGDPRGLPHNMLEDELDVDVSGRGRQVIDADFELND